MKVLAIDPGTSCGWAVGDADTVVAAGTWNLAARPGDSPGVRYLKLRGNLEEVLRAYPGLGLVAYERGTPVSFQAARASYGYIAHIEAWCAERGLEHTAVMPATLKKYATGKGNAKKDAMREMGRRRWPLDGASDDEVDARWILDWTISSLSIRSEGAAS